MNKNFVYIEYGKDHRKRCIDINLIQDIELSGKRVDVDTDKTTYFLECANEWEAGKIFRSIAELLSVRVLYMQEDDEGKNDTAEFDPVEAYAKGIVAMNIAHRISDVFGLNHYDSIIGIVQKELEKLNAGKK
jgi:hypothetical protein